MNIFTESSDNIKGFASDFKNFCKVIRVSEDKKDSISKRYQRITKQLNRDFWDSESSSNHSLYVGSFGRGTCINKVSDIDIIFRLPYDIYKQYDNYIGNGQSALLQAVKNSLAVTYSNSHIRGDGQVVQISFNDGIDFEIVPVFLNKDDISYTYPDTNSGGNWQVTNPKSEQRAISEMDKECNFNLKDLCKMARAWKSQQAVPISGMLIDTLAFSFIKDWPHKKKSYFYYDWLCRDFFKFLSEIDSNQTYWLAPGSNKRVFKTGNFQFKAKSSHRMALEAIEYEQNDMMYSAKKKWREILGSNF